MLDHLQGDTLEVFMLSAASFPSEGLQVSTEASYLLQLSNQPHLQYEWDPTTFCSKSYCLASLFKIQKAQP